MNQRNGLSVENIELRFSDFELTAHFHVGRNDRACLVGQSGSGKSTLLRVISGLRHFERYEKGVVRLDGQDLSGVPTEKRNVAFLFQEPTLFDHLNVGENVALRLKLAGVKREERQSEARRWLERIHLSQKETSSVQGLSGGEKQRVAFAQALIGHPSFVLMDEPFSALDNALRRELRALLKELLSVHACPALLVSHLEEDVEDFATRHFEIEMSPDKRVRHVKENLV